MKIYTNELGHKMAAMTIYDKNLKKSSSPSTCTTKKNLGLKLLEAFSKISNEVE